MKLIQKIALWTAVAFLVVYVITNVPAFNDEQGRNFGLFKIDTIDNWVHLLTAIIGFVAAYKSQRASSLFLVIFGVLYNLDAAVGIFLSRGFLDTSLFTMGPGSPDFGLTNILLNLPHVVIASTMMYLGIKFKNA